MPPEDPVRMGELTWEEYDQRIESGPVFLPVGSTEQHGPHLPLNVDTVIAAELAERTADRVDGVVAPPLPYGFNSQGDSGGGPDFVGTTNLDGETLRRTTADLLAEFVGDGATHLVAINGHYENEYFLRAAIDDHLDDQAGTVIIASWWDLLSADLREEIFEAVDGGFPGWTTEHAGVIETSLMLYFRPDLVREDRIENDHADRTPPYIVKPAPEETVPDTGVYYQAAAGTAAIGHQVTEDVVDTLVDGIETEFDAALFD